MTETSEYQKPANLISRTVSTEELAGKISDLQSQINNVADQCQELDKQKAVLQTKLLKLDQRIQALRRALVAIEQL